MSGVLHPAIYQAADALRARTEEHRKVIIVISDDEVDEQRPVHSYTLDQRFRSAWIQWKFVCGLMNGRLRDP
jgi:hypothetical protein